MADDGAVAVAEAPVVDVSSGESSAEESTQSTEQDKPQETVDNRKQPDALKKHIGELRRRAEALTDPIEKRTELDRIKFLYDRSGKGAAYETVYPTVREAREVKSLVDSFGGREGLIKTQETLSRVQQIDAALEAGSPEAAEAMWKEAPQGMVKLAPMIFSDLEKNAPDAYAKAVVPHAVKFFDSAGFPEAFDEMVSAYQAGDKAKGDKISANLARWFGQQRGQTQQQPKADPEVERLRGELDKTKQAQQDREVSQATQEVEAHAMPTIDRHLKAIVGKLGLSGEQMKALAKHAWDHLQDTRNKDATYKTVIQSKYKQGMGEVAKYVKEQTDDRAEDSARYVANLYYGHQLKNGAVKTPNVTQTPVSPGVTKGKEPTPAEIDYSAKGIQAARKAGFKDLSEMILSGQAPLKAGGIRKWR